jgi:carbamoyltransferase
MYEDAFFALLNQLQPRHGVKAVCLSGGCAMNSVANGKIRRATPYEKVYVQPAAGDAGGAVGAAFSVWHQTERPRAFVMNHAYWGPAYTDDTIDSLIARFADTLDAENCSDSLVTSDDQVRVRMVQAISEGKVVGWFHGRMEWGPRALGNRSILCDPRRSDMKAILNAKIKKRESFRPFAPSVLSEYVSDWFEEDDDVPFMTQVFQIRAEKRAQIPAVTHVDGSGRLHTVHAEANPQFHALIDAFRQKTGVPMVLNTSFNENEPIVCHPQEALDCFLRTDMDMLVLGNRIIERRPKPQPQ